MKLAGFVTLSLLLFVASLHVQGRPAGTSSTSAGYGEGEFQSKVPDVNRSTPSTSPPSAAEDAGEREETLTRRGLSRKFKACFGMNNGESSRSRSPDMTPIYRDGELVGYERNPSSAEVIQPSSPERETEPLIEDNTVWGQPVQEPPRVPRSHRRSRSISERAARQVGRAVAIGTAGVAGAATGTVYAAGNLMIPGEGNGGQFAVLPRNSGVVRGAAMHTANAYMENTRDSLQSGVVPSFRATSRTHSGYPNYPVYPAYPAYPPYHQPYSHHEHYQ
ncbi:hypothetical protein CBS101457_003823 [Exobasidium rhododendri]|nr:hypothetical protein CBS101457_003823 [Exobasidium rhododendri]